MTMRSTMHGPEAYLLKSKKPHIQDLVKRAETMSEDDIKGLSEKPDVIKGLLNIKKKSSNTDALKRAEMIADMMMAAQLTR